MLTPLSIVSLDQGRIWRDPCPLLDEEAAERIPEATRSGWFLAAWVGLAARLTTLTTIGRRA
jgi:hypothetical protein